MLDESGVSRDNVLEPIPQQRGRVFTIDKKDLPKGRTPCKEHDFAIDEGETHESMQGYVCKNCKFGRLIRRS